MPRLTRIYTRTGDEGMTGLGGGQRVQKDAQHVETYGTVDELNSQIGVALATGLCDRLAAELPLIQNELFDLGSDLATPAVSQARLVPRARSIPEFRKRNEPLVGPTRCRVLADRFRRFKYRLRRFTFLM